MHVERLRLETTVEYIVESERIFRMFIYNNVST